MRKQIITPSLLLIAISLFLPAITSTEDLAWADDLESIDGGFLSEVSLFEVDLNMDGKVTLSDFSKMAEYWLDSDCQESNAWCEKADIDMSGDVGLSDFIILANNWMDGVYPSSDYIDNFNDNMMGSIWTLMTSNISKFWLDETNQRLEVRATANSNDDLAIYTPNGWYLDTSQDFGFKIRYHNEVISSTWSELLFALGDSADIEDNHLQFSVCSVDDMGYSGKLFYYDNIQNGSDVDDSYFLRSSYDGWIFISYDMASDEIYFGIDGYGPTNALTTVSGLLQGDWSGKQIAPHIGGSSDRVEMLSGQAYWDDLILDYGETITQ